jgi:anti-sigma factor RsiW
MSGCDRASDLSALVDDALVPDEVASLEEHVAGCAFCQGEREGLVLVRDQLRGLPRERPPAHLTAAVMAGVLALEEERAATTAALAAPSPAPPLTAPALELPPAPVEAPAAKRKLAPFPVRPKISERRAAQPPPPPSPRRPTTCADVAEELSASFDAELSPEGKARLDLHLVGCTACQQLRFQLEMMLGEVRLLPRAAVPADFAGQVLARIDADAELERLRERASRARADQWWRGLGIMAQAAGLLLVLGTGLALTTPPSRQRWWPEPDRPRPWTLERARSDQHVASLGGQQRPPQPEVPPPLAVTAEATVLLRAPKGLVEGFSDAVNTGHAFGQVLGERLGTTEGEVVVSAPSSQLDDLVEALDRSDGLDATAGARQAIERVSTEQDRLTLANGFVLVGRVEEGPEGYVVTQGELRQVVRRQAVAATNPLERASRERTVRLVVEAGP